MKVRMKSFFDEENRMEKISKIGDPLEVLNKVIKWEMFREILKKNIVRKESNKGGRPPYDMVMMFKILVLERLYNLSDDQAEYSILNRWIENDRLDEFACKNGFGLAVFSPLYQGFLTDKYLKGIPDDSRAGRNSWLAEQLDEKMIAKLRCLNEIAEARSQKLSQMALSLLLHNPAVTTVLIGASRPEQIIENVKCIENLDFTDDEINAINETVAL